MKHLLTSLLTLISLTCLAQPTYLDLSIQLDNYPSETSWLLTQGTDTIAYAPFETYPDGVFNGFLIEETFLLESNIEYKFYMFDAFGDGNCCEYGEGWVSAENVCEGIIFEEYEFDDSSINFAFTLGPCEIPPPTVGCTDPVADNYDPEANDSNLTGFVEGGSGCNQDGWSQNYVGINLDYYNQYSDLFTVGLPILFAGNQYYIDLVAIPGNCNSGVALIYVVTDQSLADGNFGTFEPGALGGFIPVGSIWQANVCQYTPGCINELAINFNPDASLDDGSCIFITGCTDNEAPNYNPAAVFDDGSCIIPAVSACGPGEIAVTIEIELDQYPQETGWSLKDNQGNTIVEYLPGTYAGLVAGTIITEVVCLPENTPFTFFLNDTFGDGLGGEQWGGQNGSWIVYTICEVLSEGSGDFGNIFSENTNSGACDLDDFTGCTDDNYLEFDPLALVSDPSLCITEVIEGCINPNAFNFDPEANTMEMIPSCNHTLVLTDWASNSWSGAFLILVQGDQYWGPFTLLSGQDEFIFDVELSTDLPVKAFFYTPGNAVNSANQCQFQLLNPIGDIALEGGSNPFTDPMIPSPYMYIGTPLCGPVCIPVVMGCLDVEAYNFNPEANTDDICYYHPGCLNPGYVEYYTQEFTPDVEPEGACQTLAVFGCTEINSINYDPLANVDNGACIPIIVGCTDPDAYNYNVEANTDDNSCEAIVEGCTQPDQFNYNPDANTDDGSCYPFVYGCLNPNSYTYNDYDGDGVGNPLTGIDGVDVNTNNNLCVPFIYGCLDETAFNYNPDANTEDVNNPCEPFVYGCMDPTQFNYNVNANTDDGSCVEFVYGCTDELAFNYDPLANTNVGCESVIQGCTDPEAFNFNVLANTDDGTCVDVVFGCTDETAFNYNPLANTNVGCESVVEGCTDEEAINYNPQANTDNGTCEAEIFGCTDPTAFNYDELANTDNGSCEEVIFGCLDETALNYNPDANTDNGSCIEEIEGCTDPLALNYNELANVEDGSCIDAIYGCTDPNAFNYNELANADNGTCVDVVEGCTDPTAFNFNPEANTEDFSCEPFIYGCTDPQAANYDEEANTDNGTCETVYANCVDSVVETYNLLELESECFAWVIDVSPSCCNNEWADGCQTIYNYCDENTVTNIEEFGETQIIVFPNPTRDRINIASNLRINAVLYNSIGQPVLQKTNVNQLDLSQFEAGIYNLILTYNDLRFTKKIVKQ